MNVKAGDRVRVVATKAGFESLVGRTGVVLHSYVKNTFIEFDDGGVYRYEPQEGDSLELEENPFEPQ